MSRKVSRSNIMSSSFSDADFNEQSIVEDPITALMNSSGGSFNRNNNANVLDKFRLTPPLTIPNGGDNIAATSTSTTGGIPTAANVSTDLAGLQHRPLPRSGSTNTKMVGTVINKL